ncbi:MAG: lipoyl synthase [Hydrogenothermaceae bacterium]|nr:lipoyl synthase [Hydrogenothermaceae bacterium]
MKPKVISPLFPQVLKIKKLLRRLNLHTVCEEANCPNIGECFSNKTATFMIMGDICTRNCHYCSVSNGKPRPLDPLEPMKIAQAVKDLGLKYVVITSVDRDDIPDGGASHFIKVVESIRELCGNVQIELLVPDFRGNVESIKLVVESKPDVINHNIETVERLYKRVRPGGNYYRSLSLLKYVKKLDPEITTKSGFMVGLGESFQEIEKLFMDLKEQEVDIITVGQYLQPSKENLPVSKYYTDEGFEIIRKMGKDIGFREVFSGKLVRSSYHAGEVYKKSYDDFK